jgi:hypothetical protein
MLIPNLNIWRRRKLSNFWVSKVIYKINTKSIQILAIYKYIDFDENELDKE